MTSNGDRPRNWAQYKERIDSGKTGDKVAGADPAAAPLGTDAEAGGHGTPPGEIERSARAEEAFGAEAERERAAREDAVLQPARRGGSPWVYAVVVTALVVAILLLLLV